MARVIAACVLLFSLPLASHRRCSGPAGFLAPPPVACTASTGSAAAQADATLIQIEECAVLADNGIWIALIAIFLLCAAAAPLATPRLGAALLSAVIVALTLLCMLALYVDRHLHLFDDVTPGPAETAAWSAAIALAIGSVLELVLQPALFLWSRALRRNRELGDADAAGLPR